MKNYIKENEVSLEDKQMEKLLQAIEKLEQDGEYRAKRIFSDMFFQKHHQKKMDLRPLIMRKYAQWYFFFANKNSELLKTKLLKLLNYSDMIFYKENGISISGSRYVHLPYGPVLENFDILFGKMAADNIAHIDVIYENGYEKHQVVPDSQLPEGILSDAELYLRSNYHHQKFSL